MSLTTLALFLISAGLAFACSIGNRRVVSTIRDKKARSEYAELLEYVDTPIVRLFYSSSSRCLTKLDSLLILGRRDEARALLTSTLFGRHSLLRNNPELLVRAFYFYADDGEKEKAEKCLATLSSNRSGDVVESCQEYYEIMLCGSSKYINKMLELLPKAKIGKLPQLYFLLARQYENAGDLDSADKYRNLLQADVRLSTVTKSKATSKETQR